MQAFTPDFPGTLDMLLHGGDAGLMLFVCYVAIKINTRLNRDESLRSDFPPHRHVNGHILYPRDYQPAQVDDLNPEN